MKATRSIHPILFAVYPILFLYNINIDQVHSSEIIAPLIISLLITSAQWLIFNKAFHISPKVPICLTILLIWFYSYGHTISMIPGGISQRKILPLWCLLILFLAWCIKRFKGNIAPLNVFLNIAGIVLCCGAIYNIGSYEINHKQQGKYIINNTNIQTPKLSQTATGKHPDIYYIIIDSYANEQCLNGLYWYDNGNFIKSLQKDGFIVYPASRSNYPFTMTSMAATLNMDYLNKVTEPIDKSSHDLAFLMALIRENSVKRFLQGNGYKCITITSPGDIQYGFVTILLRTSLLMVIQWDDSDQARNQTLTSLKTLSNLPHTSQPFFVYAHIYCPHPPYVFGPNGEKISALSQKLHLSGINDQKHLYINQAIFMESQIKSLVNKIMAKSADKPIIIIQSDHGPKNCAPPWQLNNIVLKERFSIINAYYFPYNKEKALYKGITPINTFRTVFNNYFNAKLPLLPDDQYYCTYEKPYVYKKVTDRVNHLWGATTNNTVIHH